MGGLVPDLVVREAEPGETGGGVGLITKSVTGLGCGRAVIAQPIGLDHEVEVGPVEVDLESVDDLLRQWRRQPGLRGDGTEEDLEVGVGKAKGVPVQQGAQPPNAGLTCVAIKSSPQCLGVDEVLLVGLVHGTLEGLSVNFARQVEGVFAPVG